MSATLRHRSAGRLVGLVLGALIGLALPLASAVAGAASVRDCARGAAAFEREERSCCSIEVVREACCCARSGAHTDLAAGTDQSCPRGHELDAQGGCDCGVEAGEPLLAALLPPGGDPPTVDPPADRGRAHSDGWQQIATPTDRGRREPRARSGPDLIVRHRTYRI